jgi:hypothetical protein
LFAGRLRRACVIALLLLKLRVRRRLFPLYIRLLRPPRDAKAIIFRESRLCGSSRQPPQLRPVRKSDTLLPQKI